MRGAQELGLMVVGSGLFVAAVYKFGAPNDRPIFTEDPSYYLSGVIIGAGIGYALRLGVRFAARRYRKPAKPDLG
jgi:hypothetical protein